jgi:hypothetical protein
VLAPFGGRTNCGLARPSLSYCSASERKMTEERALNGATACTKDNEDQAEGGPAEAEGFTPLAVAADAAEQAVDFTGLTSTADVDATTEDAAEGAAVDGASSSLASNAVAAEGQQPPEAVLEEAATAEEVAAEAAEQEPPPSHEAFSASQPSSPQPTTPIVAVSAMPQPPPLSPTRTASPAVSTAHAAGSVDASPGNGPLARSNSVAAQSEVLRVRVLGADEAIVEKLLLELNSGDEDVQLAAAEHIRWVTRGGQEGAPGSAQISRRAGAALPPASVSIGILLFHPGQCALPHMPNAFLEPCAWQPSSSSKPMSWERKQGADKRLCNAPKQDAPPDTAFTLLQLMRLHLPPTRSSAAWRRRGSRVLTRAAVLCWLCCRASRRGVSCASAGI